MKNILIALSTGKKKTLQMELYEFKSFLTARTFSMLTHTSTGKRKQRSCKSAVRKSSFFSQFWWFWPFQGVLYLHLTIPVSFGVY